MSGTIAQSDAPTSPTAVEKHLRPSRKISGIPATAKAIDHRRPMT
jgi:hypothetical protein